eukprot:14763559-Alexandrium_andersonii.AAC.1
MAAQPPRPPLRRSTRTQWPVRLCRHHPPPTRAAGRPGKRPNPARRVHQQRPHATGSPAPSRPALGGEPRRSRLA